MSADLDAPGRVRDARRLPMSATDVTSQDTRVLAAALKRLLRGERVTPASLSLATGLTAGEAEAALTRLDAAGTLYMAEGIVRAAYPLSGKPTRHRLGIGGATAYANCAIDALAVPFMVDEPVRIESECAHCGGPITVHLSGGRVLAAQPAAPVVLYVAPADCCETGPAVLTRCPYINFFCGDDHATQWQVAHPERPGSLLQLAEAITRTRERFALIIRLVRGDDVPPAARYVQWLASRRE